MREGGKMTRVDGKGLWRSWKRNFKTKLLALLDLIDNSLDAGIQGVGGEGGDSGGGNGFSSRKSPSDGAFVGRVHLYPDVHQVLDGREKTATTTGLCIANNCSKRIRPLEKVLEVYNSSKVESGAGDIGENGVGLKQGCATLSDLSFVLMKNGSDEEIELGVVAESLQREEGCYLPAFKFSNEKDEGSPSLAEQMIVTFSQSQHADVARCIAQYGAASSASSPDLFVGVERLCRHFDHICENFFDNPYVFLVILDKVHHGQSGHFVDSDSHQKLTVHRLMKDLQEEIPRTYLHIPNSFDFRIGGKPAVFKYWTERLVELASFTVNVNSKIPWQKKFDEAGEHPASYELRVFLGFDALRITDTSAGKELSLYVYSRQSGRLITLHPDARNLLGLSAGGTTFCQGLTVIIDDVGGNLPLNPTKQEVAFGEEARGATHKENLMAWVGAVAHFYYNFHLAKCSEKKTLLTRKVAKYGDIVLQKHRQLKTLDGSHLTSYDVSFKSTGKSIRVDKSTAEEIVGGDTLYRLLVERGRPSSAARKRKRKAVEEEVEVVIRPPRRRPRKAAEEEEEEEEEVIRPPRKRLMKVTEKEEIARPSRRRWAPEMEEVATPPSHSRGRPRRRAAPVSFKDLESHPDDSEKEFNDSDSDSDAPSLRSDRSEAKSGAADRAPMNPEDTEEGEVNGGHRTKPKVKEEKAPAPADASDIEEGEVEEGEIEEGEVEENDDGKEAPDVGPTKEDYRNLCDKLTRKTNTQKDRIKSLKDQLAREMQHSHELQEQVRALQRKVQILQG